MTVAELQVKLKAFPDAAEVHANGIWISSDDIALDEDGDLDLLSEEDAEEADGLDLDADDDEEDEE